MWNPVTITVIVCAVLLVLLVTYWLTRKPLTPIQWILYNISWAFSRILWRTRVSGPLPLADGEGALIIANHRSSIDPFIIQLAAGPQIVHWMVAQLYGPNTIISRMLRCWEIIPVYRGSTNAAPTKTAIRLARKGKLVGMFPEGTVNTTDDFMLPVRPGAILVAMKARVPILPCYIENAPYHKVAWRPLFIPAKARLIVGTPIDLSEHYGKEHDRDLVREITLQCAREIAALAQREDFEPSNAGRDWKTWE